jgi:hypothetical protein
MKMVFLQNENEWFWDSVTNVTLSMLNSCFKWKSVGHEMFPLYSFSLVLVNDAQTKLTLVEVEKLFG